MPKAAVRYTDYFAQTIRRMREDGLLLVTAGDLTVNVPPRELAEGVARCGTVSGRDRDKFLETRLTPVPSRQVRPPIIQECVLHYECRTLHRNDMAPDTLAQAVEDEFYAQGDYHRVYFGEIVAVYADEDAAARL
jgi:flavin reductase (DIM6/NTAB) family NADH-FMN oxidoreductase RutF